MKPSLSVILITRNESSNIADCLASVHFADEIIVVDSGSNDETAQIATRMGATVINAPVWPGFGPQKNLALSYATCEWVLSLDADERVSVELKNELLATLAKPNLDAFRIPRLSSFLGHFIRHSGWYPDYVLRLFRREQGKFSDDLVHEKVVLTDGARTGKLKNHLIHYSYLTDSDYLRKLEHYSSAAAQAAYQRNKKSSLSRCITHAIWAFVKSYIFRAGFLDGRAGLLVAISSAESTYHKYLKLMLLHENSSAHSIA